MIYTGFPTRRLDGTWRKLCELTIYTVIYIRALCDSVGSRGLHKPKAKQILSDGSGQG